jgi:hypothetical protein
MLRKAITHGRSTFHLIEGLLADDGPSTTIQSLRTWYGSVDTTSCIIINHYQMKLQELQLLDKNTDLTMFINDLIGCCQKLKKRDECNMAETKRRKSIVKIRDNKHDIICQQPAKR